jgi:transcriptional regulator with XRE-family HTH domain
MNASMIGRNIKSCGEEKKITQQQLADALGITYQAVSKWECGTTLPDVTILPLIAEYFCVSIDSLFMENRL